MLTLKADIQSGAAFSTVLASLLGESGNLQGLTSSQTGSSSGAPGASLSLQSTLLTAAANNGFGTQTITPNTTGATIGSYSFTASSASGATINTVSVHVNTSTFQNLRIMVNGTQFGTTDSVVGIATYSFSGSPFTVPAGGSVNVNVVADVLSTASGLTSGGATSLTGCTGTGTLSYNALSCNSVTGQDITFSANGTNLSIAADIGQQASTQYVMPSSQVALATFDLSETKNIEPVKVTKLTITDVTNTSTVQAAYSNLQLYSGSTSLGSVQSASAYATTTAGGAVYNGYTYTFNFASGVVVPQGNSIQLVLRGDLSNYASGNATDNSTSSFQIVSSTLDVTALGASSNKPATVSLSSAAGNPMTALRTTLTPAIAAVGGTRSARNTQDEVATLTFTPNTAGPATLATTTLTFSGSLVSSTISSTFLNNVTLWLNGVQLTPAQVTSSTGSNGTGSTKTWSFAVNSSGTQIGSATTFQVYINDNAGTVAGSNGTSLGFSVGIQNSTDVVYYDSSASDGTGKSISLPAALVPQSTQISFNQGV